MVIADGKLKGRKWRLRQQADSLGGETLVLQVGKASLRIWVTSDEEYFGLGGFTEDGTRLAINLKETLE